MLSAGMRTAVVQRSLISTRATSPRRSITSGFALAAAGTSWPYSGWGGSAVNRWSMAPLERSSVEAEDAREDARVRKVAVHLGRQDGVEAVDALLRAASRVVPSDAKRNHTVLAEVSALNLAIWRKPDPLQPLALQQQDPVMPGHRVVEEVDEALPEGRVKHWHPSG